MTASSLDESPNFPIRGGCPFELPPEYARLREEQPVSRVMLPTGVPAWIITSYEYGRLFLTDRRVSVNRGHPSFPDVMNREGVGSLKMQGMLTWMDPPEHSEHRRMLINEFTVQRMRARRPAVQEIVDNRLEKLLAGPQPADLSRDLAFPVTQLVIDELLGIPVADREHFDTITADLIDRNRPPSDRVALWGEIRGYLGDLITARASDPQDDFLSRVVKRYDEAGTTDHDTLVGLAMAVRSAGHESTATMIGLSLAVLLDRPDQLAELRANQELVPRAVEELLRFFSIADRVTGRVVTEDIEIGGVMIPEGDGVLVLNAAANHDARAYADPETLDLHRDAGGHMAFGHGIHQCLGQNLARLELDVVLTTVFSRVPTLRLAVPFDELSFGQGGSFYGVKEVPVTW